MNKNFVAPAILILPHGLGGSDPACDVYSLFTPLIGLIDQGDECLSLQRGDKRQGSSDVRADLYVFRWVAESLSVTEMILWIGDMSSIDA